ncbi:macro domain-like protein [Dendrothele bispora CBS 962.96]|uniref:Macro domain-like protein n=1 Tax=Dendrothele bispora (strain CBS 962.96) TaxID=1314807 RepID=A0A4S8LSL6_DENBC|nr:macro domain-like protein [Dendrothele bispora CBS 962.96]
MSTLSAALAGKALDHALQSLWIESKRRFGQPIPCHDCGRVHNDEQHLGELTSDPSFLLDLEIHRKLTLLKELLTVRYPQPMGDELLNNVELALKHYNSLQPLTQARSLPVINVDDPILGRLALWKGDITTLSATAIVNAANSALLGCFRPQHPCIDNAIHSVAGPRLRLRCAEIVDSLPDGEADTGGCLVTLGYLLPAEYVLHTVGPIVSDDQPNEEQKQDLQSCYRACLEEAEKLQSINTQGKTVAFCCISTGMFGYPPALAVPVAVSTVIGYFEAHPNSTIAKVIFNVFSSSDYDLYLDHFRSLTKNAQLSLPIPKPYYAPLEKAISLICSADALLIFGGAGLSASCGLDYTSHRLFSTHFAATALRTGARSLYELFGYQFPTQRDKWGYYFSHLSFASSWPLHNPPAYDNLKELVSYFDDEDLFVRTSNADGLFRRHGFDVNHLSTPQGDYTWLQCVESCTEDSVFPMQPFLDVARPYLDTSEQTLSSDDAIPKCPKCQGDMFMCVRADSSFNDVRFREGERRFTKFLLSCRERKRNLVVLEIGAGWNTPSVLRWVSESLVEDKVAKLVRVGLKGSEMVSWSLEDAVGVECDANGVIEQLLKAKRDVTMGNV